MSCVQDGRGAGDRRGNVATAALLVAGATSTGGLIALVVKKLPVKTGAKLGKE